MDIFEYMRIQTGCDFISDLPLKEAAVMDILGKLPPGTWPADQIGALRDYVSGERIRKFQIVDKYTVKG